MSLLTAVEFATSDADQRIGLYRHGCAEDGDTKASGLDQDSPALLKTASSVANDIGFLERRAKAEGFQI